MLIIIKTKKGTRGAATAYWPTWPQAQRSLSPGTTASPWGEPPGGVGEGGRASPARLTATLWTILCGASLSYRSTQRFTSKSRTRSRGWRRWWGPWTGTPWRRPATGSGPGSRLSSPMTVISLNYFISICPSAYFVYFYKIGWFLAVLCDFQKMFLKFRIYRCHPVYFLTRVIFLSAVPNCPIKYRVSCPE